MALGGFETSARLLEFDQGAGTAFGLCPDGSGEATGGRTGAV